MVSQGSSRRLAGCAPPRNATHRRQVTWLVSLMLLLPTLVLPSAGPAAAYGFPRYFTVTVSGADGEVLYTQRNSSLLVDTLLMDGHEKLGILVDPDKEGVDNFSFTFGSPRGVGPGLAIGYYGNAEQYGPNKPGRAGIAAGPGFGFCNWQSGDFDIRDLHRENGQITRAWITFTRFCDGTYPIFGEIRYGYEKAAYEVFPRVVRWPITLGGYELDSPAPWDVTVRVRRTSPDATTVQSVSVVGQDADDFPVRQNGCGGPLTQSGCVVTMGFTPQEPGPRHAQLQVVTSAGTSSVSLDGFGQVGDSSLSVDIHRDDPWYPDQHFDLPVSYTVGTPYNFDSFATGAEDEWRQWKVSLARWETGATFAEGGHYEWNPNWVAERTGLRVSVGRSNGGCEVDGGSADVHDLGFTGPDDQLALLDLSFYAHCNESTPYSYTGRIHYFYREDQTPPGRVSVLSAQRTGGKATLHWTNPSAADLDRVIVRWYRGRIAPGGTSSGQVASFGLAESTSFKVPRTKPVAASLWTMDTTGNVSRPRTVVVDP
jgi:hypothetical protein